MKTRIPLLLIFVLSISSTTIDAKRNRNNHVTSPLPTVEMLHKLLFDTDLSSPKQVKKVSGLNLVYREKSTSRDYHGNFVLCTYGSNVKVEITKDDIKYKYIATGPHAFFFDCFNDLHYWLCGYTLGFKDKSDYDKYVQELTASKYYSKGKFGDLECNLCNYDDNYWLGWYVISFTPDV